MSLRVLLIVLSVTSWVVLLAAMVGVLYAVSPTLSERPVASSLIAVACFYGMRTLVAWLHLRMVTALATRPDSPLLVQFHALIPDGTVVVVLPDSAGPVCEVRWPGIGARYLLLSERSLRAEMASARVLHQIAHLYGTAHRGYLVVLTAGMGLLMSATSMASYSAPWVARAFALALAVTLADLLAHAAILRPEEARATARAKGPTPAPGGGMGLEGARGVGGPAYVLCQDGDG